MYNILRLSLVLLLIFLLTISGFAQDQFEPNNDFANSTLIDINANQSIRATISTAGDQDYYKVEITQPGVLIARLSNIPNGESYSVSLFDINQQQIAKDFGRETDPAYADKLLCTAGTYFILVEENGNNAANPNEYVLAVSFDIMDVQECNNSFDSATPINLNTSISAAIFDEGDQDYYKVEITQPGVLIARLNDIPNGESYSVSLFNTNQQEIAKDFGRETDPAYADKLVCTAGTYFILVEENGNNAGNPEQYSLAISFDINDVQECNNSFDDATPINFDTPISAAIFDEGDKDYYKVEITNPGVLIAQLNDIPSGESYSVTFFDANQEEIAKDFGRETDPIYQDELICSPGTYFVLVEENGNNAGNPELYELIVSFNDDDVYECNNSNRDAPLINPCTDISGNILPAGDEDFYQINISQAGTYQASVRDVPSNFAIVISVIDEAGTQIERCSGNTGFVTNCEFSIPSSGVYFVKITANSSSSFSKNLYTLTFSDVPCSIVPEICNNGQDDDGDGLTDCEDPDCSEFEDCKDDGNNTCTNVSINLPATTLVAETCTGNDGSIAVVPNGGTAPYRFVWSTNAVTLSASTLNNLSADTYFLTVTDANGCIGMESFVIIDGCTTVPEICDNGIDDDGDGLIDCEDSDCSNSDNCSSNSCDDLSVGIGIAPIQDCIRSFKLTPSGGTAPYTFLWRDGQTTDSIAYDISINPNYAYTVTDSEGCTFIGGNTATCTPPNNNSDGTCSDEDMAFLIGEWTGTFDQITPAIQSTMTMEVISAEDGLFLGAMIRPDILSEARIVVGTCRNDSIWWSETESLDDLDLMGLYLSEPGNHTTTTIDGDYFNTDPAEFAGTFSLTKNCSYPIAEFTPTIGANGQVQFQNTSQNNPLAQFWEFGDGGESIIESPTHTYTANGTYEVSLVVSNGCGSRGDDTLKQAIVIDNIGGNSSSTIRLYAGEVEGSAGDQVLVPIIVENLDTITVLEGQILLDNPAIGQIIGVQAGAIDVGTVNMTSLRIGYFAANGVGIALNSTDTLFYLIVELTGNPDDMSLVTLPNFEIYGAFSSNSFDPLPYDTQNGKITITGNFDIMGRVQTFENTGIPNTTIDLAITLPNGNQDTKTTTTQNDGSYAFQDIPAGSTCTILPSKNTDVKNGLSTAALFLGQRYILGLSAPQINNPFQLFAGDANCDDRFSTVDLFLIQKVLVEIDDSFTDCDGSWDFTPETDRSLFAMNLDYHTGTIRKSLALTPSGDVTADFIGVKKGDLLNLADPANLLNELAESRATRSVTLEMVKTTKGNMVEIAFYPTQTTDLASYQLAFNFDQQALDFSEIIQGSTSPLTNVAADGTLLMSWFTPTGKDIILTKNTPVFSLIFYQKSKEDSGLVLAEDRLAPIGFDTNLEKWALRLSNAIEATTSFNLYQSTPNPFATTTAIRFDLPTATTATLVVTNNLGQIVHQQKGEYAQGKNVIQFTANTLPKGLYYYTISTTQFSATKRLLVID